MHDRNAESWHKNNYYNRDRNSFSNNDNYYDRQGRRDENIKHSNEGNRLWNRNREGNQYWDKRNNYVNRNDDRQRYNREENKDRRSDEGRFERRVYRNNNITRGRGVARDQERNVTGHLNNVNVEIKRGDDELSADSDQDDIKVDNAKYEEKEIRRSQDNDNEIKKLKEDIEKREQQWREEK
ncbi:hypothetical protein RN001_007445 [Aquatica leii]|uniref:Uncharacterized protein n=1 Tax=Aquatica leii TaxID=1421715 RepID=A0AAN7SGU2_9COLE|nr:hypothetical protein RN001_007445 [Aquatica leii]